MRIRILMASAVLAFISAAPVSTDPEDNAPDIILAGSGSDTVVWDNPTGNLPPIVAPNN